AAAQVHPGPRRRIHRLRDLRIDFSLKYTARHTSRLKKLAGLWPSPGGLDGRTHDRMAIEDHLGMGGCGKICPRTGIVTIQNEETRAPMKTSKGNLLFVLILILGSCQPVQNTPPVPSPSVASPAATLTATPEPTTTSTPTSTAMPTFLPPLPVGTPEEVVLELLRSNHGCQLPCWWGIMPGVTTYPQVTTLLEPLAKRPLYIGGSPMTYGLLGAEFTLQEIYSSLTEVRLDIDFIEGIVQSIVVYGFEIPDLYDVGRIMDQFGPPEDILISTVQTNIYPSLPFILFMFYPDLGMFLSYSVDGYSNGQTIRACLDTWVSYVPSFYLWSPGVTETMADVLEMWAIKFDWFVLHSLEEATGMTVEAFYETYRHPAADPCINTPAEIWPISP
ncbi:MAG: hypothetical protein ABIJ39_05235, partial [Chloroflexota bacterium]